MVGLSNDKKSKCWILTQTDSEGYHRQVSLTVRELAQLTCQLQQIWK